MAERPSEEHIQLAIDREREILDSGDTDLVTRYLETLSHKKMTDRHSAQELRDGCILITHCFTDLEH